MQSSKFNQFSLLSILPTFLFIMFNFTPTKAMAVFTDNQCLESGFATKVSHKAFPFGLTETSLEVEKKDCHLIVRHEKLKFIKKQWDVDVCRGPIHIKYGATSVEVIKRQGICKSLESDFCKMADDLFKVLQDDGLIFAPGEKEDLASSHGRINCSYLLLKSYLEGGNVFARQEQYEGILKRYSNSWDSLGSPAPTPEALVQPKTPDVVSTPTAQSPTQNQTDNQNNNVPVVKPTPVSENLPTPSASKADF